MAKRKRFSIKELREWMYETAMEAISNNSFNTGTCYYKNLSGGVSAVINWSESDDFKYEEDNPFMKKSKNYMCCGKEITAAYCLEVALRETESFGDYGNLPCDWLYWDTHMPGAEQYGLEGALYFDKSDMDDKMKHMAHYISSERTQFLKYNKYYD